MRYYIFTKRERQAVQRFLAGKLPRNDPVLEQLRTRMKEAKLSLSRDIELYSKFRETVATALA